ncbi:Hypothetical protein A7982_01214 [Minicystis rosea]|nr:Hypothetical protein A7982_01214 [Minicystis rosea]
MVARAAAAGGVEAATAASFLASSARCTGPFEGVPVPSHRWTVPGGPKPALWLSLLDLGEHLPDVPWRRRFFCSATHEMTPARCQVHAAATLFRPR